MAISHIGKYTIDYLNTESLSVDWVNNKIYWTDISERRIGVIDLLGKNNYKYDLLSTGENSSPRGIAVDPTTRYLCNIICVCAIKKKKVSLFSSELHAYTHDKQ